LTPKNHQKEKISSNSFKAGEEKSVFGISTSSLDSFDSVAVEVARGLDWHGGEFGVIKVEPFVVWVEFSLSWTEKYQFF
jgi:hypothetical protein